MQATDAQLVTLAQTGDTAAFGELVRRYNGLIYGLAYHGVGNFTDAQDIAQEAFVKAFRRLDQLAQPDRFAAWLKTVTANECKMWLRGSKRPITLEEAESLHSCASAAAESWRHRERQAEIRQAVDSLPEKSRLIVNLHYLSGLSHREIGEFLGMAANAVSQHLHRARQQLKDMLIAQVEEGYAMNKLPEGFTEEVLGKITLYPIVEGVFMTVGEEGDPQHGITMAVAGHGAEKAYITFWTKNDDLGEIVYGTIPGRTSESAKGRALDSALDILNAFGIELKQVVLRSSGERRCRAAVELRQGKKELTVDMRPSDAMGLAVRVNAPICAEDAVVKLGNVGEDDVPTPDGNMDPAAYNEEFEKIRQRDLISNKAFEMVSLEDLVDTVRFRKDEEHGVLRMWLEAVPENEVTFDLREYGLGVQMLFDHASRGLPGGLRRGGEPGRGWKERYNYLYSMLGEDVRMRIVRETDENTPEAASQE